MNAHAGKGDAAACERVMRGLKAGGGGGREGEGPVNSSQKRE
jgi:hypothetical protein